MNIAKIENFADVQEEFDRRVRLVVWAAMSTIDSKTRTRVRMIHPIWEYVDGQPVGWIGTGTESLKIKHLENNPAFSLSYWDQRHQQIMIDAEAELVHDADEKQRIWNLAGSEPEPYGYDYSMFWKDVSDPNLTLIKIRPWRVELWELEAIMQGQPPQVWKP